MPDITTQIARLDAEARELRGLVAAIDELLSGPKPQAPEGNTLDSSISGGLQETIQAVEDVLREANSVAAAILRTVRDDGDQCVAAEDPGRYASIRTVGDVDLVRIS